MVSIWPTAEGQIAWTEHLAPPSCSRFLVCCPAQSVGISRSHTDDVVGQRYYVAWLTAIAWIFMTSSATFICAVSVSPAHAWLFGTPLDGTAVELCSMPRSAALTRLDTIRLRALRVCATRPTCRKGGILRSCCALFFIYADVSRPAI